MTHSPPPWLCRGLVGTVLTLAREEGVGALYKGLAPGTPGLAV